MDITEAYLNSGLFNYARRISYRIAGIEYIFKMLEMVEVATVDELLNYVAHHLVLTNGHVRRLKDLLKELVAYGYLELISITKPSYAAGNRLHQLKEMQQELDFLIETCIRIEEEPTDKHTSKYSLHKTDPGVSVGYMYTDLSLNDSLRQEHLKQLSLASKNNSRK